MTLHDSPSISPPPTVSNSEEAHSKDQLDRPGIVQIWLSGMRTLGRLLWFCFNFVILMAPLNWLTTKIAPESMPLFGNDGFHGPAWINLALALFCVPFIAYFAAKWSGQLRSK